MKQVAQDLRKESIRSLMNMLENEDTYFRSQEIDLDQALKRHEHAEAISQVLIEKLSAVETEIERLSAPSEA